MNAVIAVMEIVAAVGDQQADAAQRGERGEGDDEGRQSHPARRRSRGRCTDRQRRSTSVIGTDRHQDRHLSWVSSQRDDDGGEAEQCAPTERSMPAVMMTKVSPSARIAIIEPGAQGSSDVALGHEGVWLNDRSQQPSAPAAAHQGQPRAGCRCADWPAPRRSAWAAHRATLLWARGRLAAVASHADRLRVRTSSCSRHSCGRAWRPGARARNTCSVSASS